MPPASSPKPTTKKPGAPKTKGAVRAKSGCYTCRIRRKKCDERPDAEGRCETCLRLRLQCLGFGAKRPDWLRESNNVTELRDKIKSFLASQGMIKGHSGSGPRAPEQEPPTLHLSTQNYNEPSESPPSQLLVLTDEIVRQSAISNVREEWPYPPPGAPGYPPNMIQHPPYISQHLFMIAPPPLQPPQSQLRPTVPPTIASRFGASYTTVFLDDPTDQGYSSQQIHPVQPLTADGNLDELANHYMNTVAALQYQLADRYSFPQIFKNVIEKEGVARNAARILALVHVQRSQAPMAQALEDIQTRKRYDELLQMFSFAKEQFDDDDALAALNIISTFLFDGGNGDWERWLHVAFLYSNSILNDRSRFLDYRDALMNSTDKERFIVKTTFWFDVLASVTTMKKPNFVEVIHELYNPSNQSGLSEISDDSDSLSMLSVMGCENRIVWALAKISELHVWKEHRAKSGSLSIVELSRRAEDIEMHLAPSVPPLRPRTQDDIPRLLASEVFRTSAIVYLRTIVSGDHPLVREISEAVDDAVVSLERVAAESKVNVKHVVVRSTVFAFFVCAALTTKPTKRAFLLKQLKDEGEVGNCRGILDILQNLHVRLQKPKEVPWRSILRESRMLLV
ncbi:fungal-specific transcription factor domain-containing protein [Lentinula lateritia]|uniref:Fungal-specific transcription factor domain-containing protein n=1 Tax=Lentinula aff. lateritia TaxID=2804960 RepID=A0ACC1U2E0_9AGAR|nr:fungal-specific transcription factor domain-containing protein [Lentinula aff. lateritia]KAJ3853237.1 fungal-specific transcription factor domain-containing protein [Lentinula lateritia]